MTSTTTKKTALEEFQAMRITALEEEITRLNIQLNEVKLSALKARVSDPIFLKPLSEINVDYELVKGN